MFPPQQSISLDIEALSGICGSISIACWVVVFSPQIIENFRRRSADGLSVVFLVVWLAGDVFNILGAILQGVLPTMIILAVYYTLADIVLLVQVFYYRGFTLSDEIKQQHHDHHHHHHHQQHHQHIAANGETQPLLRGANGAEEGEAEARHDEQRNSSISALRKHLSNVDGTHLSPATPLIDAPNLMTPPAAPQKPASMLQALTFNTFAVLLVCAAGVLGWWIGVRRTHRTPNHHHHAQDDDEPSPLDFDVWGQVFGYLCAALYLGSRVPQLLLNYRRKSTEGVSLLFFLFACIGNLTYDMSIFAYSPVCRVPAQCEPGEPRAIYARYILLNASWIAGSLGTLLLDMAIFVQFFLYRAEEEDDTDEEEGVEESLIEGSAT